MHVCVYLTTRNHQNYPNVGAGCWYTGFIAIITIIKRANKDHTRSSKERKLASPPCLPHLCIFGTYTLAWTILFTRCGTYKLLEGGGGKREMVSVNYTVAAILHNCLSEIPILILLYIVFEMNIRTVGIRNNIICTHLGGHNLLILSLHDNG